MTRRLDAVTAVTRVLLDNSTFSEAVTLQRSARLLAGEIADWVIIDIDRGGRLLRQFAAGPRGGQSDQLARLARGVDPDRESLPALVHAPVSLVRALAQLGADTGLQGSVRTRAPSVSSSASRRSGSQPTIAAICRRPSELRWPRACSICSAASSSAPSSIGMA